MNLDATRVSEQKPVFFDAAWALPQYTMYCGITYLMVQPTYVIDIIIIIMVVSLMAVESKENILTT